MRIKVILLLIIVILSLSKGLATIINIPTDQPTIQAGIDAANNGDTILVHPGTYYENIDYLGKNITVASLELTTGNESYIASTIINGNQSGSCVWIADDITNAVLRGFSITNGSGSYYYQTIRGGGILIKNNATAYIVNCHIFENNATSGGAITIIQSTIYLEGTRITNNNAITGGGGIYTSHESGVYFDEENRCSIYNNYASYGPDIYALEEYHQSNEIHVVLDTFSILEPQYYFANDNLDENPYTFDILNGYIEPINHDLYVAPNGNDDNSGLSLQEPLRSINTALFRIYPDSLDPKTIYLAEGVYSRSANDQIYPLAAKKNVKIIGANMGTTIIDDENTSGILGFSTKHNNIIVKNITFQNAFGSIAIYMNRNTNVLFENIIIENNINESLSALFARICNNITFRNVIVRNNIADENIAGIFVSEGQDTYLENCVFENNCSNGVEESPYNALVLDSDGEIRLNNCVFKDNEDYTNSGVCVFALSSYFDDEADIKINNCLIENNFSANGERLCSTGAIEGSVDITNCTFADNSGELSTLSLFGNANLTNNIFYNNTPYEIFLPNLISGGTNTILNVSHCNIQNGIDGIYNEDGVNTINWLEGNLPPDAEPQFIGGGNYQLSAISPCIDAGTQDTLGLFLPPWDLLNNYRIWDGDDDGSEIIDMGCYEFGANEYVGIIEPEIIVPSQIEISNYPNPFNPETTIQFNLLKEGDVQLEIYNIKGQRIKQLVSNSANQFSEGEHSVVWDGTDNQNKSVSSGVYFYTLKLGDRVVANKRMLLLK